MHLQILDTRKQLLFKRTVFLRPVLMYVLNPTTVLSTFNALCPLPVTKLKSEHQLCLTFHYLLGQTAVSRGEEKYLSFISNAQLLLVVC